MIKTTLYAHVKNTFKNKVMRFSPDSTYSRFKTSRRFVDRTLTHHLPDSYIQSCSPLSRLTLAFEPVHSGGEAPDLLSPGLEARPRPRPAPPPPLAHLASHDVVVLVRVGVGDLVQSEGSTGSRDHVSANESSPCPRLGRAAPCR